MDGLLLTAAICASRTAYEEISRAGIDVESLPEAAGVVVRAAGEQYKRDAGLTKIDNDVLRSQVVRRYGEGDMAHSVMDFVAQFPDDCSAVNVAEEHRLLRLAQVSRSLATMLATNQHGEASEELLAQYQDLKHDRQEDDNTRWRLEFEDFQEDSSVRVPIAPKALNDYIGGGVLRGHNITVYGRPDSGKSGFALNCAAMLLHRGYKVLYVANEEPEQDITRRLLSRMCATDIEELRNHHTLMQCLDNVEQAYQNWYLLHRAGLTADAIRIMAAKVKPDMIIVDQLKNVATKEDNRALQLDKLARQVREIGIEAEAVTMSVTQAGESGQNELVLGLSDVEWSNTGIPGAADLMVGIGVDELYRSEGKRMLSVPKNKVNGKHGAFPVWFNPKQTKFSSKRI